MSQKLDILKHKYRNLSINQIGVPDIS